MIIDLDADIEKSSSSNLDSSLVIPLQGSAGLNNPSRVDNKTQVTECGKSSEEQNSNISKGKQSILVIDETFNKISFHLDKEETAKMSSAANSGSKGTSKMSIDHQVG